MLLLQCENEASDYATNNAAKNKLYVFSKIHHAKQFDLANYLGREP